MSELEYQSLLKRRGTPPGVPTAPTPPASPPRQELGLLHQIQALAKQHGWIGQHTVREDTQDVECFLVRDVLLYALLQPDHTPLTPRQLAWVTALRETGAIEVYIWGKKDIEAIKQRLAQPRQKGIPHAGSHPL